MASPNTILLKGKHANRREERRAASPISPGMAVEMVSGADTIQPHSVRGGRMIKAIALEAMFTAGGFPGGAFVGGTINDTYATGDLVYFHQCLPTDEVLALLHVGESVVKADWLQSYGDGTFCKAASSVIADIVADSAPVTNTVALTPFSNGSVLIPKNTLKVGDVIRILAQGDFPSTNSTDTAIITVKIGATTIVATAALDVANGDTFLVDVNLTIRTIGAAGTFVGFATTNVGTPGTSTTRAWELASTAIDTTVDQTVTVNVTWSVANAADQAILHNLRIEQVKPGVSSMGGAGGEIFGQCLEAVDLSAASANGFVRTQVK